MQLADLRRPDPRVLDRLLCRIRAADPGGPALLRRAGRVAAATVAPRREASPLAPVASRLALGLAALGAGVLARNAFMADKPYAFYSLLVATAVLVFALVETVRPHTTGAAAVAARAFLLFALALPFADALYRSSTGLPLVATTAAPTYSYRAAHANPTAFATWWFYYLNEWIREDGIRAAIDAPDPQKKLPFVLVPGSSGRMFDTTIRINNLGFRGPDMPRDKGDAFRIVALGESQTFGPTLRDGEKPWPELLQDLFDQHASCGRKIEVINAGTEAYTLENNLERMRRDILPLKPDLIVSTHGMNGFLPFGLRRVPEPNEPGVRPRASALIGRAVLTIERAAHDWRDRNSAQASAAALAPMSDAELMKSRYADDYRKLIALARDKRRGYRARRCNHGGQRIEPARGQGLLRRGVQADRRHHRRQRRAQPHGQAHRPRGGRAADRHGRGRRRRMGRRPLSRHRPLHRKRATNGSPTSCSGRCCRSWRSGTACTATCAEGGSRPSRQCGGRSATGSTSSTTRSRLMPLPMRPF